MRKNPTPAETITPNVDAAAALGAIADPAAKTDGTEFDLQDPTTMQRRLWVLLPLAGLSISLIWGGMLQALIARQVAGYPGGHGSSAAGILGTVLTIGAISSVVFTPIVGRMSDRTRTRFLGRRNIWILGGAIAGAIMMALTSLSPNAIVLAILLAVSLVPLNGFQGAASAVVPERVPIPIRARLTAINGMAALVGIGVGASLGALLPIGFAYLALGLQLIVVGVVFAFATRDVRPPERPAGQRPTRSKLPGLRSAPDFWWVFGGRFLAFLGYDLATSLQLYALRDYVKVGDGSTGAASAALPEVVLTSTALLVVSAIVGGILADKTGRMKPFVIGASILFIPATVVLALVPTLPAMLVGFGLLGFGFGSYVSVDGALITRVLPRLRDAGRDLGVLNIANAGPQVIAPALAGALVSFSGYPALFVTAAVVAALASVAVALVRSVR